MNKYISTNRNFKNSINLQYDINNYRKMNDYILTDYGLEMIEQLLDNVLGNTKNNANILVGPYGKGKSHMMLLILGLLRDKGYKKLDNIIEKMKEKNYSLYEKIIKIKNKKYLPIVVTSGYEEFNKTILIAINETLTKEKLNEFVPDNYYTESLKIIKKWLSNDEAKLKLENELKVLNINSEILVKNINSYDIESYNIFKKIYKIIMYGSEFNPLINSNVIEIIKNLNDTLINSTEYDGIYIVFDEFSKFLEGSIKSNVSAELNSIQQLAELSNSSKRKLFFTCITHKPMNEYIYQISESKIDAWKAIEGRFKEYHFTASSRSSYELISNTINKIDDYEDVFNSLITKSNDIYEAMSATGMFEGDDVDAKLMTHECFPLNPITAFCLIRVSEKVAQNERTLFTFLASDGHNTLNDFLNKNEKKLVNLDLLYDYFAKTFEQETYNKKIYNIWIKANTALKNTDVQIEKKIIKSLAIINIVNEYKYLNPNSVSVARALGYKNESSKSNEIKNAILSLEEKNILMEKTSNNHIEFLPGSNINIKEKIRKTVELKIKKYNYCEELDLVVKPGYIIPKKYNYENKMIRFYKKIFLEYENINKIDFYQLLKDSNSDGILVYLLDIEIDYSVDEIIKIREKYDDRIVFVISEESFDVKDKIKEVMAINILLEDENLVANNKYIISELNMYKRDIEEFIINQYNNTFINYENLKFITKEENKFINNKEFNRYISTLCEDIFNKTVIINNELVNKKILSSQIKKSKDKILLKILTGSELGSKLMGNSSEATLYRTLILNKNLENSFDSNDENLNNVLNEINEFILTAEESKQEISDLYLKLTNPPFGIRKGVISIYLSIILTKYKNNIVLYFNDKELDINVDSLNKADKNPELYSILLEKGTKEKEDYLNGIEEIFKNEDTFLNKSNINRYHYITDLMQEFIRSLPKFSKEFNQYYSDKSLIPLDSKSIKLRKYLLKYGVNSHELLFVIIPNKIFTGMNYYEILTELRNFKIVHQEHINNVKKYLNKELKILLDPTHEGEIGTLLENWMVSVDNDGKRIYANQTILSIFKYIEKLNNYNDNFIIGRIAKIVTSYNIEDWNDNFVSKCIKDFSMNIEEMNKDFSSKKSDENNVKIKFNDESDERYIRVSEIKGNSMHLKNELENIIDEYMDQVEVNQLENVLLKILSKI